MTDRRRSHVGPYWSPQTTTDGNDPGADPGGLKGSEDPHQGPGEGVSDSDPPHAIILFLFTSEKCDRVKC